MATYVEIASVTVGSGGASYIEFTGITADWTDLKIAYSARGTESAVYSDFNLRFNGSTSGYSERMLYSGGSGTPGSAATSGSLINWGAINAATSTANTFGNGEIYIPNYAGSQYKSFSQDVVTENNATSVIDILHAGLWSNTAAITSIRMTPASGTIVEYSTAYLYGIKKD